MAGILLFCFTALFFTSIKLRHRNLRPGVPETESIALTKGSRKLLPPEVPRVALLFFGLTRSLKFTLPSIEGNILGPLQELGVQVDIFIHTYNDTDDASSKHTASDEWRMLRPTAHVITSQELFLNTTEYDPLLKSMLLKSMRKELMLDLLQHSCLSVAVNIPAA